METIYFLLLIVFIILIIFFIAKKQNKIKLNDLNNLFGVQALNQPLNNKSVFKNNQIFKNIKNLNEEPYYVIDQKQKINNKEFKKLLNEENDEILKFNIEFYNMHDRINNTSDNYNNSVNKINDLRINNDLGFNTKLLNQTIKELYNKLI